MAMKILLISYYFLPSSSIGAKRWHKIYAQNNLDLCVLAANFAGEKIDGVHYLGSEISPSPAKSLANKPSFLDILRHPTIAMRSLDRSIRSSFVKEAKEWIKTNRGENFDLIIASYAPLASIIVGNYAKTTYNCPLVVDLRDLLSLQGQKLRLPLLHCFDVLLDKFFMRKSSAILVVSKTMQRVAKDFYKKPVHILYNSTNSFLLQDLNIKDKNHVRIFYAGSLGYRRDPSKILAILDDYASKKNIHIEVIFAGIDDPNDFLKKPLHYVSLSHLGYLQKNALSEEFQKSSILLVLENQNKDGDENITGKIFDYLGKKPIMVSCSPTSDILGVLEKTKAGRLVQTQEDLDLFLHEKHAIDEDGMRFYTTPHQLELLKVFLYGVLR